MPLINRSVGVTYIIPHAPFFVDFTTFPYHYHETGSGGTMPGNEFEVYSYTIPEDGLYFIEGLVSLYTDSADGDPLMAIKINGEGKLAMRVFTKQYSGESGGSASEPIFVTRLQKDDVVSFVINGSSARGVSAIYWQSTQHTIARIA